MEKKIFKSPMFLITYAIILIAMVAKYDLVVAGLREMLAILTPLFVGLLLAFVLSKPYDALCYFFGKVLEGKWLATLIKPLAIAVVYLGMFGVVVGVVAFMVPQLSSSVALFSTNISSYSHNVMNLAQQIATILGVSSGEVMGHIEKFITDLPQLASKLVAGVVPQIFDFTMGLFAMIFYLLIGLILSIYFLLDKERIGRQIKRLMSAFLSIQVAGRMEHVGQMISRTYIQFITGQMIEMVILGTLCTLGMWMIGLPYALLIGVIIGVTNLIPVAGAWIGALPAVFILFMVSPMQALYFIIFLLILQQIESNLIYPRVVGGSVGLAAQWTLLAIVIGGGLLGVIGMLFAVPTASVIYQLLREAVSARLDVVVSKES